MKWRRSITMYLMILFGLKAVTPRGVGAQDEWEKVLAKAKKEGRVGVMGPLGTDTRDALTHPFMK